MAETSHCFLWNKGQRMFLQRKLLFFAASRQPNVFYQQGKHRNFFTEPHPSFLPFLFCACVKFYSIYVPPKQNVWMANQRAQSSEYNYTVVCCRYDISRIVFFAKSRDDKITGEKCIGWYCYYGYWTQWTPQLLQNYYWSKTSSWLINCLLRRRWNRCTVLEIW